MTKHGVFDPAMGFEYVGECFRAISERRYRDALTLLDEGISMHAKSAKDVNTGELLKHLGALITYLDFRLGEDFGAQWEVQPNDEDESEVRCSFCGKKQSEVKKIIAGPTASVCSECVKACSDILAEEQL